MSKLVRNSVQWPVIKVKLLFLTYSYFDIWLWRWQHLASRYLNPRHKVMESLGHTGKVCGVKWRNDGEVLML